MRNYYNASIVIDNNNNNVTLCFQMFKGGSMHEESFDGLAEAVKFCNDNGIHVPIKNCIVIQ